MVNQFGGVDTAAAATRVFGGKDVLEFYAITTTGGGGGVMADIGFCCAMLVLLMLIFAFLGGLALSKLNHSSR